MDRLERTGNLADAIDTTVSAAAARIWTALPAVVQSVDFERQTLTAQPALLGSQALESGDTQTVSMPLLVDVPICYPRCADFALTLPIKAGDEVLIVFAARCIDSWWQNGGVDNVPAEQRICDLSDGFAVLAPTSQPKRLTNVNSSNVQLRNTAGDVFVEIDPSGRVQIKANEFVANIAENATWNVGGGFTINAGGAVNVNGSTITDTASLITENGDVVLNGALTQNGGGSGATFSNGIQAGGDIKAGSISLQGHTHGGVITGGDNTSTPN
jgi:hypothetical protein